MPSCHPSWRWMHSSTACGGGEQCTMHSCIGTSLWADTCLTQQVSPSMADLEPHVIRSSLDPPEWAPQTASRSVQPFLHRSAVWRTSSLLLVASVAIGRISCTVCRWCGLIIISTFVYCKNGAVVHARKQVSLYVSGKRCHSQQRDLEGCVQNSEFCN